MIFLTNFST